MVYQELNLLPHLSVAENIFISSLPRTRTGLIDWKQLYLSAKQSLERLGLRVTEADVKVRLESLSVAQQQIVAIARALRHIRNVFPGNMSVCHHPYACRRTRGSFHMISFQLLNERDAI